MLEQVNRINDRFLEASREGTVSPGPRKEALLALREFNNSMMRVDRHLARWNRPDLVERAKEVRDLYRDFKTATTGGAFPFYAAGNDRLVLRDADLAYRKLVQALDGLLVDVAQ